MILFEIAIGVLLLIDGKGFTTAVFIIFGSVMLLLGVISLIQTLISAKKEGVFHPVALIIAGILIAVGIFFTATASSVLSVMSAVLVIYGIIMIISSFFKLADYFTMKNLGAQSGFGLFSAAVSLIMGILFVFNPFGAAVAIWTLMGIMLIASATLDLIALILYGIKIRSVDMTMIEATVEDEDEE